ALRAMVSASPIAWPVMNTTMLLRIFTTWPAPWSPQWVTSLPMQERYGRSASHASAGPPTMMLKVPSCAAWRVRATGASTNARPRGVARGAPGGRARRGGFRHQPGGAGAHVDGGVTAPAGARDAARAQAHALALAPARQQKKDRVGPRRDLGNIRARLEPARG